MGAVLSGLKWLVRTLSRIRAVRAPRSVVWAAVGAGLLAGSDWLTAAVLVAVETRNAFVTLPLASLAVTVGLTQSLAVALAYRLGVATLTWWQWWLVGVPLLLVVTMLGVAYGSAFLDQLVTMVPVLEPMVLLPRSVIALAVPAVFVWGVLRVAARDRRARARRAV